MPTPLTKGGRRWEKISPEKSGNVSKTRQFGPPKVLEFPPTGRSQENDELPIFPHHDRMLVQTFQISVFLTRLFSNYLPMPIL